MNYLNNEQLAIVRKYVVKSGARNITLKNELVDHIASKIEELMVVNHNFHEAFDKITNQFSSEQIERIVQNRSKIRQPLKRKKAKVFSSIAASICLMLFALAVFASNKPNISPIPSMKTSVGSHYNQLIGAYTFDISENLDICATAAGRVTYVRNFLNDGTIHYVVRIDHQGDYQTIYSNLNELTVSKNTLVKKEQVIGKINQCSGDKPAYFVYKILKSGKALKAEPQH